MHELSEVMEGFLGKHNVWTKHLTHAANSSQVPLSDDEVSAVAQGDDTSHYPMRTSPTKSRMQVRACFSPCLCQTWQHPLATEQQTLGTLERSTPPHCILAFVEPNASGLPSREGARKDLRMGINRWWESLRHPLKVCQLTGHPCDPVVSPAVMCC